MLVGGFGAVSQVDASQAIENCIRAGRDIESCAHLEEGNGLSKPSTPSRNPLTCDFGGDDATVQHLIGYIICLINFSIIPLIFALALVMFLWGVVQFVINTSDEAKKAKGREFMLWGIIALAVMLSVWGLVNILSNTFDIDPTFIPQVKSPTS